MEKDLAIRYGLASEKAMGGLRWNYGIVQNALSVPDFVLYMTELSPYV